MKKVKIGISFILLIIVCIIFNKFALLLNYFFALAFHELAHLFVSKSKGYSLKVVNIDMFGMSIELNETIDDKDNFSINIAGPALNLLLVLVCMSLYWIYPKSFIYLNSFCMANLALAVFNLLPIYPLDGGKIFSGFIKSDKGYKRIDIFIRLIFVVIFVSVFIYSLNSAPNVFVLVLLLFFVMSRNKRKPTMSIFKYTTNKSFNKVTMLKVSENQNLFNLIKKIKSSHYTIFYIPQTKCFIDEEDLVDLATKLPLTTTIKEIK